MSWQVDYLSNDETVMVNTSGPMTLEDFVRLHAAGVTAAQEHHTRQILVDARETTMAIPPTQLYGLPALLEEKGLTRGYRVALVTGNHAKADENLSFLETVFYNRGFSLRVFTETVAALTWLKPGTAPSTETETDPDTDEA